MARCTICGKSAEDISRELGLCLSCIRSRPEESLRHALHIHKKSRVYFGLPEEPPQDADGIPCGICVNECRIPLGGMGYCGLRKNESGSLTGISAEQAKLSWYHDPLPTNCVGDWVCAGGTGAGYPLYAYRSEAEYGYENLAVFFHACSFNCLFCQNWHFRKETLTSRSLSTDALVAAVRRKTSCICYFGGDPAPQVPFAIRASEKAREKSEGRICRICWETNGSMNSALLDHMIELSLESGGCIKFDLKSWDDTLHRALTGCTNQRTLENFSRAALKTSLRPVPPLLIANTLLVPGYIDEIEIQAISRFIASVDPTIPFSMLAFYPHFLMSDLPRTSGRFADRCLEIARAEGLTNVRIGNIHLLS